ncbi:hypothetical protein E4U52_000195, partial [Claviceps spartinae]
MAEISTASRADDSQVHYVVYMAPLDPPSEELRRATREASVSTSSSGRILKADERDGYPRML